MKTANTVKQTLIKFDDEVLTLDLTQRYLANQQLVIKAVTNEGYPYATLSTCLDRYSLSPDCTFYDLNNNGDELLNLLIENKICVKTGKIGRSGHCEYPEIRILSELPLQ